MHIASFGPSMAPSSFMWNNKFLYAPTSFAFKAIHAKHTCFKVLIIPPHFFITFVPRMPVYWSVILQVFVRWCSSTNANTEKRLMTASRPASEKPVAARCLNGVIELTVGETILIDNILFGIHRRLDVIGTLLLSTSQSPHRLIFRVVTPCS